MGHQPKLGSYGKNWIFGPKTEISGPKKVLTSGWTPCSGRDTDGLNGKVIDTYLLYIFHLYFAQASKFQPRADVEEEGEQDGRGAADEAP